MRRFVASPVLTALSGAFMSNAMRAACCLLAASSALAGSAVIQAPSPLEPLSNAWRPEPSQIGDYVANKTVAIALGKALFWESRLGSDGRTACASCHYHAGSDTRSRNTLSPGFNAAGLADMARMGGPSYQWKIDDFPLHAFANPDDNRSPVVRSLSVVAGAQGVYLSQYVSAPAGQDEDLRQTKPDPVFHIGAINTRQVTPRKAQTMINAIFNLRAFWDGRGQADFNGASRWAERDVNARVYRNTGARQLGSFDVFGVDPLCGFRGGRLTAVQVSIDNAQIASQAVGPVLSNREMSADGRTWPDVGHRLQSMRALADQHVARDDSVLAPWRHTSGRGLTPTYGQLVRLAFRPEWWNSAETVLLGGQTYSQYEANFSLFFGLAVQLYEATLVSDQTPLDSYLEGDGRALTAQQKHGLALFNGKAKCINCHGGPAMTNASVQRAQQVGKVNGLQMADGGVALYDEGFFNSGVTRNADDPGIGGPDLFGGPLSYVASAQKRIAQGKQLSGPLASLTRLGITPATRIAVNGAFKTPGLRNIALTAPYFHNASMLTLMQVVEFYNRGGNFPVESRQDLPASITPLGMSQSEKEALVAFLRGLTDDRVRRHAAPFDHPSLEIPDGALGTATQVYNDGAGRALESTRLIPAAGRNGYSELRIPANFLEQH